MGRKIIDPKQQFSKWLAKWTAIYWFFYMTWLSVVMYLQPQAAQYTVYMGIIASVVMLINIYAYNKNSLTEKALLTLLDKTRIEIAGKNGKSSVLSAEPAQTEEGEADG